MSSAATGYEPECPACGWILPEEWRRKHDRRLWDCRHCGRTFRVHEVLS